MLERSEVAAKISALLSLDHPPVGLSFVTQQPEGVAAAEQSVPSSCSFWRAAEQGVFYADAEKHFNCPIGAMVMGFELPESVTNQLGGLVQSMCDAGYIGRDEASKMPSVGRASRGIVYGRLSEFPMGPDLILLWLNPSQAMLFNEATGSASWSTEPMDVSGRPGCTALPLALEGGQPRVSFGCAGMRVFTEIPDNLVLAVLPGHRAGEFVEGLEETIRANEHMRDFYEEHKANVG